MLAESNRIRTGMDRGIGPAASRNRAARFSTPSGTILHYGQSQQVVPRNKERVADSGRRMSAFAGASKTGDGRLERSDRWSQGEATLIAALLACAVVACLLGVVYLAAYMKVAYQGRQIHNLQADLTAETARQHALIYDIGWLESPGRIAQKAKAMGMVMGSKADYVIVHTSTTHDSANSNPTTLAANTPSIGTRALGDN